MNEWVKKKAKNLSRRWSKKIFENKVWEDMKKEWERRKERQDREKKLGRNFIVKEKKGRGAE